MIWVYLLITIVALLLFRKMNVEGFSDIDNTAYLSFVVDDYMHIYYDKKSQKPVDKPPSSRYGVKMVSKLSYNGFKTPTKSTIKNFKPGDKIILYWLNTYGSGGFAGHIKHNGVYYPTNNKNFKITGVYHNNKYHSAGKLLGCYRDTNVRALPHYQGSGYNTEECRLKSIQSGHSIYGLQYGGQCWTGNSEADAKRFGSLVNSRCNMKRTKYNRTQHLGGSMANILYSSLSPPNLTYINKAYVRGIDASAWVMRSEEGLDKTHGTGTWYQIEFTLPKRKDKLLKFCPDPEYTEFNPTGCKGLLDYYFVNNIKNSCENLHHRNYKPDMTQCINKFDISGNNYNNEDFFVLVRTILKSYMMYWRNTGVVKRFKKALESVMSVSCKIREMHDTGYNAKDCIRLTNIHNSKNVPAIFDNINKAMEICKKNKQNHDESVLHNNSNKFLCEKLHDDIRVVIDTARIIIARLTRRNDCRCMEFTRSGPKCMPC